MINKKVTKEEIIIPDWLPVVPLSNNVLFPGATAPLAVKSDDANQSVEVAAKGKRLFAAVAVKNDQADEEERTFHDYYKVGTASFIIRMMRGSDDMTQLVVRGIQKIQIHEFKYDNDVLLAQIEPIQESFEKSNQIEALMRQVSEQAEVLIQKAPMLPNELQGLPSTVENPHRLAYMVLSLTRSDVHTLQRIYETNSLEEKLRETLRLVSRELEITEIGGKIQSEIQARMSKSEREYFLREQLRAIRKELGETDEGNVEVQELRKRLYENNVPDTVREKAEAEIKRFERMNPSSPEYSMTRNYLDWLLEFPWRVETTDKIDIQEAEKILDEDHYDLERIKERILEYLAVRKLNPSISGPILCFVGPPGVGKTSLGLSIARALGRKFVRISLGGVHDEAEIRGHRRTYIGALPGTIVQHIRRAGSINPVFMLDEIDKIGQDFRGDPSSALLEVLDPAQNSTFRDHYMEINIDLSKVLFIATANNPERIQPPLRDRMEEIRLAGYTTNEKVQIAERYLVPKAIRENGLVKSDVRFGKGGLEFLIQGYTREAGVRNLERSIQAVARKVAVRKIKNQWRKRKISPDLIRELLGSEQFQDEVARRTSRPGVATGLAWTPVGGEILFIEALPIRGGKGVQLTGKLGEVMRESAKAAYSLVRTHQDQLRIPEDFFKQNEIHLHVPAGAVPKDGPSAGITIATALASAATKKPIRHDLAMTGEITLSGMVLPVGGIKEKVIAAHRAGIKEIIIPSRNQKDLEDVDDQIKKELTFTLVDTIDEVFEKGFMNGNSSGGKPPAHRSTRRKSKGRSKPYEEPNLK
ncbi:MAG: endopeptidase La [bacterium]|jgi:ATP-dependent Lon protease